MINLSLVDTIIVCALFVILIGVILWQEKEKFYLFLDSKDAKTIQKYNDTTINSLTATIKNLEVDLAGARNVNQMLMNTLKGITPKQEQEPLETKKVDKNNLH